MAERDVEGVDLDQLEDMYTDFEKAVAAALAQAMKDSINAGALAAGSAAALSLDDLNVIPTQWARQVPQLAEDLTAIYVKSAGMQADAFVRAGGVVTDELVDEVTDGVAKAIRRFTSEHAASLDYLAAANNRLVGVGDDLWFNARTSLLEGMDAGESIPDLTTRVKSSVGVTEARARTIARTEAISASNGGSIAFMRATGQVATKAWLAHRDERTRIQHRDADGQEVDLDAKFVVGGFPMDRPGDPSAPAHLIASCRCVMRFGLTPDTADLAQVADTLAASGHEETTMTITVDDDQVMVAAMTGPTAPWAGVICVTGEPTGDRRQFDSLSWAELPLPLRHNVEESHGGVPSTKAVLVGRIDTITMQGRNAYATGVIDLGSEAGREAARLMGTQESPGYLRGVSIDGDEVPGQPSTVEMVFAPGCADLGPESTPEQMMACMEPQLTIWSNVRIRGATMTDVPAIATANLYLTDGVPEVDGRPVISDDEEMGDLMVASTDTTMADVVEALVAAAHLIEIADVPPAEWFVEPSEMPEYGAIQIDDNGRLFGYVAAAGQQHRSYVGSGKEVRTPMGNVDYGLWETRARVVQLADGTTKRIATGAITLDCGHAPTSGAQARSGAVALAHYDQSCSLFATACIGENKHGVWIAGALLPDVGPAQIARAMACQLSGDWRPHSQKRGLREFAGCLLVPVPGLPMGNQRRSSVTVQDGQLVASATPVVFAGETECEPCALAASAAPGDDGNANAARMIAMSVGYDRADHARRIYESVRG